MLEQLLEIARTQGYLTYSDILEALPQPEHHVADVDQLYAALQSEGIRVVETPAEITEAPASIEEELLAELPDLTDIALDDPVRMYLQEIGQVPLLSAEQEVTLAKQMETGDWAKSVLEREEYQSWQDRCSLEQQLMRGNEARQHLIQANLRLVVSIAKKYTSYGLTMMDLVQEGNIGLMQAVKRYDPYRGVKLSSYAAWWIRAYILRFILNNWRMVKIGTTQAQRKLFFNLSKEKQKLTAMGIEPTHAEIAKRLDVEEQEVIEMDRRLSRADASLDAQVGESDGKPTTRMDLLPATAAGPDESAESSEIQELLKVHLAEFRTTLKDKDVAIFDKRLVADEPLTLQQLGDEFGVSRERVRQLEARLTGKLRIFLTERLGDAVGVSGG